MHPPEVLAQIEELIGLAESLRRPGRLDESEEVLREGVRRDLTEFADARGALR
jgi:hypothetical protein